jgi:beta-N-acetylhexosaminidase
VNLETTRAALAQSLVVGFDASEAGERELALVGSQGLGGVILFRRNLADPLQVWELCYRLRRAAAEAGRPPLFVMVDQEGGTVARLHQPFTDGPDLAELGGAGPEALEAHGARLGAELAAAGFNWNLAPVVDVHAAPDGVMARRSLGSDPERVGELAAAYIAGQEAAGCLACAKHFPGLGRTTADTHRERPEVGLSRQELERVELVPFRAAAAAGVAGVMVSHAVFTSLDPDRPASLSPAVVRLLREELGFGGLVLSDDLEMGAIAHALDPAQAALQAYLAGCDLLLMCHTPALALEALDGLEWLARQGEIGPQRLQASRARIRAVKDRLPALPDDPSGLARVLGARA